MRSKLDIFLKNLLVLLMAVMVISTLIQVFARVVNLNFPFTEELTVYAMMWVTLFGSAYAFGLKKHISINILSSSLKEEDRWKLEIVVELIIMLFAFIILLFGGSRFVFITFKLGQVSSVMQIPKGWVYLALPLNGLLIILYNILNIKDSLIKRQS